MEATEGPDVPSGAEEQRRSGKIETGRKADFRKLGGVLCS
jgi:hypothetical protein